MRARIAITAATAALAVASAATITAAAATASASEYTSAVATAPTSTGQPAKPTSTPPRSTAAPEPSKTTTPPAPGKPVKPPKGTFTGMASWFTPDGVEGACGERIRDTDMSVALDYRMYESGGSGRSAYCGMNVVVTYKGKSVTLRVVDASPTTPKNGLELTPGAFSALASRDGGDIKVTWHFAK
ncbi:RlpA-like double-psi beta-barrel domain-containing protein [Streptomyces sp. NPDC006703]|uniref:RlpA-like double-psi beta-barrel domain-containing protein n=1 Tax=Streptomyces sp. NPDC006703 TaxID=3364759 RepID=UPI0036933707